MADVFISCRNTPVRRTLDPGLLEVLAANREFADPAPCPRSPCAELVPDGIR